MQALQSIICDIIEGKRGGRGIAFFLYLCSRLYAGAGFLRNLAYDKKWLKDTSVDAVVISIGNIVSGGTGKTPFIHHLAKELEGFCKLAILSRGYRSKMEHAPSPQKLDRQKGGAEEWGDEPCWLAAQLPDVDVWVGKRRSLSAALASSQGAQVILLDDGMQYRHLKRDIEIALIDACDPFGKGYFLPRGYLRDHPKRLQSADLVVINNVEDEEHYLSVKTLLLQQGIAKVIGARVEVQDKMAIRNKRVALFCGIAKPLHFEKTLRKVGVEIVDRLVTLDHVGFARKRLEAFAHSAAKAGAEFLVCTEKDAVKLPKGWNVDLPIVPLKTRLEIVADMQEWQRFIVKIKEKIL